MTELNCSDKMKILLLRTHNESFCLCTFHDLPRKQQQLSEIQYTPRNARPSSIQKNEEFTNHPQTSKKEIRRTTSKESSNLTKTFRSNSESPQDTRTSTHKQRAVEHVQAKNPAEAQQSHITRRRSSCRRNDHLLRAETSK